MGELLELLSTRRETLLAALEERLGRAAWGGRLSECRHGGAESLCDALAAACGPDGPSAARRWADALWREGRPHGLVLEDVLDALAALEQTARLLVVKLHDLKKPLVAALDQAAAGAETLRRAALAAALEAGAALLDEPAAAPGAEPPSGRRRGEQPSRRDPADAEAPASPEALQAALDEARARKNAILESSLDPIITINHEGVITEFNRAAEQVFGLPRDRVLGTKPSEVLFPPSSGLGRQDRIDRYLESGEGSLLGRRIEVTAVRAGGEPFAAEMAMTIGFEQGEPVLTFFIRDISQRKRAEEEQARWAAELERSNRELEQFAYIASHDLQEPLRKIRMFGDRLEAKCAGQLDDIGRECVERMQAAAARMQGLIDGLLTLSRVTTRGQQFVPVDLAQIAREVLSDLEDRVQRAGAQVEIGPLPTLQADPLQMRQLLQNLIGNALKFRRVDAPPRVKLSGRYVHGRHERRAGGETADERCRILVEDNGIGFDPKHADRIFGLFQRLHPRDVYEGTGVGLAICRRIVERHGGTISARSTPGEGSTFEVVLPVFHGKKGGSP